ILGYFWIYLCPILGSLCPPGRRWRQFGGALVGVGVSLLTCGPHALHSLLTVLGSWALLACLPRSDLGGLRVFGESLSLWGGP
uniref:Uncharacterized protein n=1 Tax=Taeniopygia guttata TaxID=59729 RepID=A0A674HE39_TAEGU